MDFAPNFFSSNHGNGVKLQNHCTEAVSCGFQEAVAYTALPIGVGHLYELKVIENGNLVSCV